jgi:two-component system, cell cycle response regulator
MSRAKVLTIEGVLDDARFLDEALAEAQETQETSLLLAGLHLEDVEDAVAVLGSEPIDAVLLGVHDGGREALEAFFSIRTAAPQVPVIAVVDADDREFARTLLRQGAQDYLVRGEFDYIPLARALENAIERHRVLWAAQNASMFDATTGFLNQRGFAVVANHRSHECGVSVVILCELDFGDAAPDARDLMLLEGAAIVREAVQDDALVARCGPARFGILARLSDPEPVRSAIERLAERESAAFRLRFGSAPVSLGSSLESALAIAEKRLCENRLAYVDHLL